MCFLLCRKYIELYAHYLDNLYASERCYCYRCFSIFSFGMTSILLVSTGVAVVIWHEALLFFECPKTGIVVSNSARNVDVCWLFFFEVLVLALAQRPPEMSWWMCACPECHMLVVNWNRSESLLSERWRRRKFPNVAENKLKHSADWNWSQVKGKGRPITCREGTECGKRYNLLFL
jgi:hypothetical protein